MSRPSHLLPILALLALPGCGASVTLAPAESDASTPTVRDASAVTTPDVVTPPPSADLPLGPPRPLAPLSTAAVTSRRPTLRWVPGAGSDRTRVEICRDRACALVEHALDVRGDRVRPPVDLAPGAHFWRLVAQRGERVHDAPSATWAFFVGPRSTPIDTSWGTTLDLNGDGLADLAAATTGDAHRVVVHHGAETGIRREATTELSSRGRDYGAAIANAGDIDGDGYGDLLVQEGFTGTPADLSFPVNVHRGGAAGVDPSRRATLPVESPGCLGEVRLSMASAGDVNGDGYGDVVIGAPCAAAVGRAYVFLGSASGLGATPAATLSGRYRSSRFGWSVASADFNGDGRSDIAVAAWGNSSGWSGEVTVAYGASTGIDQDRVTTWEPGVAGFAVTLGAGDVNGDGYADLAVASRGGTGEGERAGVVRIYPGGPRALVPGAPMVSLTDGVPPSRDGYFAGDLVVGDLNGDGFADLLATAYSSTLGNHWLRRFDGGPTGPDAAPRGSMTRSEVSAAHYASGQVAVGDHDGDGRADVTLLGRGANVYRSQPGPDWLAPGALITAREGEWFSSVVGSR
jgi:hypothetical protein